MLGKDFVQCRLRHSKQTSDSAYALMHNNDIVKFFLKIKSNLLKIA